jgi:hypothetical protein
LRDGGESPVSPEAALAAAELGKEVALTNTYTRDQKIVRRLKTEKYVPEDIPIRLVNHPRSKIRWEAENASTGEKLHVGGTASREDMFKCEWVREDEDGWILLYPGEPHVPDLPGGGYIRNYTGNAKRRFPGL